MSLQAEQQQTFLITGARGCIGAWVLKNLLERGSRPIVLDIDLSDHRFYPLIESDLLDGTKFVQGDIANYSEVERTVLENGVTHAIHLAGLQVPFCAADPIKGARTNVQGTLSLFEIARAHPDILKYVVYASSAAVFGPPEFYGDGPVREGAPLRPDTHYGVFKQCNEENARIYFQDSGISSCSLRPWAVYGFGRDRGRSSGPTKAIKAAVLRCPYTIPFTGGLDLQYADDIAKIFVQCADKALPGAKIYAPRGSAMVVEQFIERLSEVIPESRGLISASGPTQRLAYDIRDGNLIRDFGPLKTTSIEDGIKETFALFERLRNEGKLDDSELHDEARAHPRKESVNALSNSNLTF
jgi:nucleoside-diphosphate-sugar epimerase